MRLGVLTSHPIQYQAVLFRALAKKLDLQVYFAHRQSAEQQAEAGFGTPFEWDIALLDGYSHRFLANRAARPSVSRFNGCNTPEIASRIEQQDFDAFLVTGWHLRSYWQAVAACRRRGVPVLMRGDALLGNERWTIRRAVKRIVYPRLLRSFDRFCVVGQRFREYLRHYGVPDAKMFFAPHHVDNEWFRERARLEDAEGLRQSLGARSGEALILLAGKLIPIKRPLDVLEAVRMLAHQGFAAQLVVAGSGPLEAEMKALARAGGVRASFLGFQNQSRMPRLYAAADVLALTSRRETWGLVVNEAMACGTPAVVSSGAGCAPDLIEEGTTGVIYECGNIAALAQAIRETCLRGKSPAVRAALSRKLATYCVHTAASGIMQAIGAKA
jgi:glycosyltransferase involved in cell wall biosynthesis